MWVSSSYASPSKHWAHDATCECFLFRISWTKHKTIQFWNSFTTHNVQFWDKGLYMKMLWLLLLLWSFEMPLKFQIIVHYSVLLRVVTDYFTKVKYFCQQIYRFFYLFLQHSDVLFQVIRTVPAIKHGHFSILCHNTPLMGTDTKMDYSILFPVKSRYIFW